MNRIRVSSVALLFVLTSLMPFAMQSPTAPAPGTDTGQKIGTIVKTAIDTALPAVGSLINLFWKKGDGDKQTKQELQANIDKSQADLKKQFANKAQEKLKPVADVASELLVVGRFLEPATLAHEAVIQMQSRPTIDKTDWDVAKRQLDQIDKIADTDVNIIRDKWLRDTLMQIKGVNNKLAIRIKGEIDKPSPNKTQLAVNLAQLEAVLGSITQAVGYELSDLQADLKGLSDWAKGAAGGMKEPTITQQQERYLKKINGAIAAVPK